MRTGDIEFATAEQIAKAFKGMSAADHLRLEQFARFRAHAMPWLNWRDLVHEAVKRSLEGERRWPMQIPFIQFLRECVRSLAHEEMRQHSERPIVAAAELPAEDPDAILATGRDEGAGPERRLAAEQAIDALARHFAADAAALAVLDGLSMGLSPGEVCEKNSLTKTEYESAQKRIRRWALATEPSDLPESQS